MPRGHELHRNGVIDAIFGEKEIIETRDKHLTIAHMLSTFTPHLDEIMDCERRPALVPILEEDEETPGVHTENVFMPEAPFFDGTLSEDITRLNRVIMRNRNLIHDRILLFDNPHSERSGDREKTLSRHNKISRTT